MARDRDFPLPRELLPDLDVSQRDYVACKDFSARLLGHTVRAFEHFAYDRLGEVDTKFWKPQATRDELSIYRERQPGRVSESLGDSLHRCAAKSPLFSVTPAAITPATMMLTGVRHGFVENAVSTLVTKSQEELALVIRYLHGASSDCGILHTMESPTDADPFHFLGFKYYVSQAVGDPRLLKRRHCVYLEDSGFTRTRTGEKLGYHIMHSVHLPQFPDLRSRNSIPALMSTRFLYRQREEGIVEVFMLGNIDIKGLVVKPISLRYAVETMFNMTRLLDCSETKRLTLMAREHLCRKKQERRWGDSPVDSDGSPVNDPNACSMCERVGNANVVECLVCGRAACSRCRASKQVFVSSSDGLLGRLIMVPVCTGCILDANTSFFDMLRSQRRGRSRSSGFRRNTLDYRPSSRSKRRGGSCRTMDVAMRSPSVDRRQRYTSYCKEDKKPADPRDAAVESRAVHLFIETAVGRHSSSSWADPIDSERGLDHHRRAKSETHSSVTLEAASSSEKLLQSTNVSSIDYSFSNSLPTSPPTCLQSDLYNGTLLRNKFPMRCAWASNALCNKAAKIAHQRHRS